VSRNVFTRCEVCLEAGGHYFKTSLKGGQVNCVIKQHVNLQLKQASYAVIFTQHLPWQGKKVEISCVEAVLGRRIREICFGEDVD
jgi:hypothetical protein